jgi:hypothetical protein
MVAVSETSDQPVPGPRAVTWLTACPSQRCFTGAHRNRFAAASGIGGMAENAQDPQDGGEKRLSRFCQPDQHVFGASDHCLVAVRDRGCCRDQGGSRHKFRRQPNPDRIGLVILAAESRDMARDLRAAWRQAALAHHNWARFGESGPETQVGCVPRRKVAVFRS